MKSSIWVVTFVIAALASPVICLARPPRAFSVLNLGAVVSGGLTIRRNPDASRLFSPPSGTYPFERPYMSGGVGFGFEFLPPVLLGLMVEYGALGVTFDDWFVNPTSRLTQHAWWRK